MSKRKDNWKDKKTGMVCANCRFYVPKAGTMKDIGRCRRRSPTLDGWPVMFTTDWCGDFKMDENKK